MRLIAGLVHSNVETFVSVPMTADATFARRAATNKQLMFHIAHYRRMSSLTALAERVLWKTWIVREPPARSPFHIVRSCA